MGLRTAGRRGVLCLRRAASRRCERNGGSDELLGEGEDVCEEGEIFDAKVVRDDTVRIERADAAHERRRAGLRDEGVVMQRKLARCEQGKNNDGGKLQARHSNA